MSMVLVMKVFTEEKNEPPPLFQRDMVRELITAGVMTKLLL